MSSIVCGATLATSAATSSSQKRKLGGDMVGLGDHLVLVGAQDDLAVIAPRHPGDVGGAQ